MRAEKRQDDSGAAAGGGNEPGDAPKKKRSLLQGVRDRINTAVGLGRTLINEPRAFPGHLKRVLFLWARETWHARGGGFYACGFVATFAYLEIRLLFVELFTSAGDFVVEQVLQIVLRFTVDSLVNTLLALIWPALILGMSPLWGVVGLALGYVVFARFLKEPLSAWLFEDR